MYTYHRCKGLLGRSHNLLLRLVVVVMEGETMVLHPHWTTVDSRPMEIDKGQVDVN